MTYDFDTPIDRRGTDSLKWSAYPADVLPLWVADMDFATPEPVMAALRHRLGHPVFGYGCEPEPLRQAVVERLHRLYAWDVSPETIVFLPGVIPGLNLACAALMGEGAGVLVQTPVYPGILQAAAMAGRVRQTAPLTLRADGHHGFDADAFEAAIDASTRAFILCNPHNPVGRAWTREELRSMAEACLRHRVPILSDEIHCDLVYAPHHHVPIASLDPEVAANTVTLMAPSKTYNIPGLHCSFAVVTDPVMRERFQAARAGMVGSSNVLGFVAALAAYEEADDWLQQLLVYLRANATLLCEYVQTHLPGVQVTMPEATFLGWLDFRPAGIGDDPFGFFLEHAKVALGSGPDFGPGGEGFARLNFACPRSRLAEALDRMRQAMEHHRR